MIQLDTSFLIRGLVGGSKQDRLLREWLRGGVAIGISAIGWTEFLCGPVEADHVELAKQFLQDPAPFLAQDAALAARLFNMAGRRRGSLIDCMIAATAVRAGALLATSNPADFRKFEPLGVRLAAI